MKTKAWIDGNVEQFKRKGLITRVQFVRQPDSDDNGNITLFVARDGKLVRCQKDSYDAIHRLNLETSMLDKVHDQQYFVCTNGQRDLCCALRNTCLL